MAVWAARTFFHLPYYRANMHLEVHGDETTYFAQRGDKVFEGTYTAGEFVDPAKDSFERWATERYCLYTHDSQGRSCRGHIHHKTWPLQSATAQLNQQSYLNDLGVKSQHPAVLYSRSIEVAIWLLERG